MRYSYEYKRKCVELYREGKWLDTPDGISDQMFHVTVRQWSRIEESQGHSGLN